MKFGLLTEGNLWSGKKLLSFEEKYKEILEQAKLADQVGFYSFGCAEQHFYYPNCVLSSPEIVLSSVAALTKNIKIRTAVTLLPYQHPVKVAENIATLDLMANGRVEFGTGKGNSLYTIEGFGFKANDVELTERWRESLEVIVKAWTNESFSHEGKYYKVPERTLTPKPVQKPHPALWYATLSPKSHEIAGRSGLGVMTSTLAIEFEKMARNVELYKKAAQNPEPIGKVVNNRIAILPPLHVGETMQKAREVASQHMVRYLNDIVDLYEQKLKATGLNLDFTRTRNMLDWDYLNDANMVVVGDPDYVIERLEKFEAVGADEIVVLTDGIPHEEAMKSIELIGKYVIPHFEAKEKKKANEN
jgi:alkanesulfonate monooxygenase SsuD/methylene tetrahydromethanopterin reductase-like flavin-dependent oxidoreductase (luciferase family)